MLYAKCASCDRWVALARRTSEERNAWARACEKHMAEQAERERRRTLEVLGGRTIDPFGNGYQFDTV